MTTHLPLVNNLTKENETIYLCYEYKQLSEDLNGSLVTLDVSGENYGVGVVVNHRRWYGHFHVYVFWITSPYIKFKFERQTGWHEFERLTILSKPR